MESIEYFNETPGIEGEMSVKFDVTTGCVRAYGSGFWSTRQAHAFFTNWKQIIGRIHASGHCVSALVNMDEGVVQKAEVAVIIATATESLYRPGDAIAMLVSTNLAKMQMRRIHDPQFHQFFVSRNAAETWLKGKSIRPSGDFRHVVAA